MKIMKKNEKIYKDNKKINKLHTASNINTNINNIRLPPTPAYSYPHVHILNKVLGMYVCMLLRLHWGNKLPRRNIHTISENFTIMNILLLVTFPPFGTSHIHPTHLLLYLPTSLSVCLSVCILSLLPQPYKQNY